LFINELELPLPDWNLGVGSCSHAEQTSKIIMGVGHVLENNNPDLVLVHGDTNTSLGAALSAAKMNISLGHVEAGLRSFNKTMPEEINRKVVDQLSDINFCPTKVAYQNLRNEGIKNSINLITGNTIKDAINWMKSNVVWDGDILNNLGIIKESYALVTIHRAKITNDILLFEEVINGITRFANSSNIEFVYPIHPRAKQRLNDHNFDMPNQIKLVDPQSYSDFLQLQQNAAIVFTDSGGVQEEACILGTPCVTLRNDTERPETLAIGCNVLAGYDRYDIAEKGLIQLGRSLSKESVYGQGDSSRLIFNAILDEYN
jgi:UDP-N-acetylglucosamine 2-epimerase (non-hydrolysing)